VVCALDKEELDANFELAQTFIDNGVRKCTSSKWLQLKTSERENMYRQTVRKSFRV